MQVFKNFDVSNTGKLTPDDLVQVLSGGKIKKYVQGGQDEVSGSALHGACSMSRNKAKHLVFCKSFTESHSRERISDRLLVITFFK